MNVDFQHKQEVLAFLEEEDISKNNICLAGSVVLSVRGLRENNDVDMIIQNENVGELDNVPGFLDIIEGSFECIGFSDNELVYDSYYYDVIDGLKILRPELVFSYKYYHKRQKDIPDIDLIEEYALNNQEDWNWDLVKYRGLHYYSEGGIFQHLYTSIKGKGLFNALWDIYQNQIRPNSINVLNLIRKFYFITEHRDETHIYYPIDKLITKQLKLGNFDESDVLNYLQELQHSFMHEYQYLSSKEAFLEQISQGDFAMPTISITLDGRVQSTRSFAVLLFLNTQLAHIKINNCSDIDIDLDIPKPPQWSSDASIDPKIQKVKVETLRNYGIIFPAIIWPKVREKHDEIEQKISEEEGVSMHNSFEVRFDDVSSFSQFIRSLYSNSPNPDWSVEKKIHEMKPYNTIKVIELEFPSSALEGGVVRRARELKRKYRMEYKQEVNDYFADVIIHMGDDYSENRRIFELIDKHNK